MHLCALCVWFYRQMFCWIVFLAFLEQINGEQQQCTIVPPDRHTPSELWSWSLYEPALYNNSVGVNAALICGRGLSVLCVILHVNLIIFQISLTNSDPTWHSSNSHTVSPVGYFTLIQVILIFKKSNYFTCVVKCGHSVMYLVSASSNDTVEVHYYFHPRGWVEVWDWVNFGDCYILLRTYPPV